MNRKEVIYRPDEIPPQCKPMQRIYGTTQMERLPARIVTTHPNATINYTSGAYSPDYTNVGIVKSDST